MIEKIVIEVIKKLENSPTGEKPTIKPKLLVMNMLDSNDAKITELKKRWNVIEILDSSQLPLDVKKILFLGANQDLFVKGALGITDTPESKLLANVLMQGLDVKFIPSSDFKWILDMDKRSYILSAYLRHLFKYKELLDKFGVRMIPLQSLLPLVSSSRNNDEQITFHEKLLTEECVNNVDTEKIVISKSTIVTPLARDAARELGKVICLIDS